MYVSLDCLLKVDTRVMSQGFSSGKGKSCADVLGEDCLVLCAPQCDGETECVEYFDVDCCELFFRWLKCAC